MTATSDLAPTRAYPPAERARLPRSLLSYRSRRSAYPHRRERIALTLLALGVIAYLGILVQQYERARSLLRAQEQSADRSHFALDSARKTIAWTDREIATTRAHTAETRAKSAQRVREREVLRSGLDATRTRVADAGARLGLTETAVFIIGLHQREVAECLDGIRGATDAIGSGDDAAAVASLRAAAPSCSTALIAATGTRFPFDFPDPSVIRVGGTYYGYSTNSGVGDIQVIRSNDLLTWEIVGNGLAALPPWAEPNRTWAPSVLSAGGSFVVYYTAQDRGSSRQCVSRATGVSPNGPFTDVSSSPLVCQLDRGGSIDPSAVMSDDGTPWLLWKSEGFGAEPAAIWSQQLSPDGLSLVGLPTQLMRADQAWEHGVVEGPYMVLDSGDWYLFYSGGDWKTRGYAVGYARCDGPAGPCSKPRSSPVLASDGRLAGPGGQELFRDGSGGLWMAFHAYTEPDVGYPSSRTLHLLRIRFAGGAPVFEAGT